MIRLKRPEEPDALRRERAWRLADALLSPPDELPPDTKGYRAEDVPERLARDAQKWLCAYCGGAPVEAKHDDVEHFRPRASYWWLTWTWENLWISCNTCQAKEFKLAPDSPRLSAPTIEAPERAFETWREQALLLDPAVDDPTQHLRVQPDPHGRWWWNPVPGSDRGRHTYETLKLQRNHAARSGAFERLQKHLNRRVKPDCDRVCALLDSDVSRARREWTSLCERHLYRESIFLAPTWWYLAHVHKTRDLSTHEFEMTPYPDDHPGAPAQWPIPVWLEDLPDWLTEPRARLLVTYVRNHQNAERLRAAIVAVCDGRSQSITTLATLLYKSEKTIQDYVRGLRKDGRLSQTDDRPPRYIAVSVPR